MARTTTPNSTKSIVKQALKKTQKKKEKPTELHQILIPTPSSLLNCACSDTSLGAFIPGTMINVIGDSSTGKTFLALSILAEMAKMDDYFGDHRFLFDDVENANAFNMEKLFGKKCVSRIESPKVDEDGEDQPSDTIEDFHINISNALKKGKPFIYILDSFDALDSDQDREKIEEMRKAKEKGTKPAGSYGMSKPKKSSEILRNITGQLKKTKSNLIIISQTRDNISPMSFEKKTRSGGRALKFYASHEMWLANVGKLISKKTPIGNQVEVRISKNKLTGKSRQISFNIYNDYGIDDIRSSVDWLVGEGYWEKKKLTIDAKQLRIKGSIDTIVREIENRGVEHKLKKIVGRKWLEVEETLKLNRKPKYL